MMVEFKIKVHPEQRIAYFPRQLVDCLGFELTAVPNSAACLLFPQNADPEDVLKSLQLIRAELQHSIALKQKGVVVNNGSH